MSFEREPVTLRMDRKRLAIDLSFLDRPGSRAPAPSKKTGRALNLSRNDLVSDMTVPRLSRRKMKALDLSGGPAPFDCTLPVASAKKSIRRETPGG